MINQLMMSIFCLLSAFTTSVFLSIHSQELTIATYNVWNPIYEERYSGKNTWDQRLPYIINNILESDSDFIGLEEIGKQNYLDLLNNKEISSRYMSFYISHAPSNSSYKEGRDGLAFFYKPEVATLKTLVQSSDDLRPTQRRDYYADLKIIDQESVTIRFAGTHLDSSSIIDGNLQLSALVNDVLNPETTNDIDLVVIFGDFNEGEHEKERPHAEIMINNGFFTDGSLVATRPESLDVRHNGHIDWIYFKGIKNLNFKLLPGKTLGDERASDHKLTSSKIIL